jgi:hypothetical protein
MPRTQLKLRHVLLLLPLAGCPDGLAPPLAEIREGDSQEAERTGGCDNAPAGIEVQVGEAARVHGACSHDPNGLDLSYQWALVDQPSGSKLEIPNLTVISPTVVPDLPGRYRLSLLVSNGTLTSPRAYVDIDAQAADLP